MARLSRQSKILELIAKYEIDTQEDLQRRLKDCGIAVTQATVSRDIKELGLVKTGSENKKYRYAVDKSASKNISIKMRNMFRESVVSIDATGNLVVIKTLTGSADAAGVLIDHLELEGVMCCISGDDAVLIVVKSEQYVESVLSRLNEIVEF